MKFIRITQDNDQAIEELCQDVPAIVCKEGPDAEKNCRKVHYHLLMDSDLSDNGIRKQIYKYFNIADEDKGQKTCAFTKVKDKEGALRYVCKGLSNIKPEIVLNTMEIDVDLYYNAFWDIFTSLKESGAKEREATKSRTQEFMDYFDNGYCGPDRVRFRKQLGTVEICNIMCHWFKNNKYKLPPKWSGQQIVMSCYNLYSEQPSKDKVLLWYYGFGELSDFAS